MAEREERRFAQVSRESVTLMAESAGVELGEEIAAVLAEDVCYRLREAAQVRAACTLKSDSCRKCWLLSGKRIVSSLYSGLLDLKKT